MASVMRIEHNHNLTSAQGLINTLGLQGGGGGGNGGGGGGKGSADNINRVRSEIEKGNKGNKKNLGATLGIKFGVASLLKQSQVYTGFIGSMFQLFGALVDVILAPFLPILIPGVRLVASMIPIVSSYAQKIYEFLDMQIVERLRNLPIPDWIKNNVSSALSAVLMGAVMLKVTGLWNPVAKALTKFLLLPLWEALKKFMPDLLTSLRVVAGDVGKAIWDKLGPALSAFGNIGKWIGQGLWDSIGKFLLSPFKGIWGALTKGATEAGDGIIARGISKLMGTEVMKGITRIGSGIVTGLGNHISSLFTWVFKEFPGMIKNLAVVKGIMKFVSKELGGSILARALKGAGGAIASKIGTKAGLKAAVTGLKAIPVLGGFAELGFGGYQAYQDYKKYGGKAAMGRLGLTAVTAGASFIDPSGLTSAAFSAGSHIAMDMAYERKVGVRADFADRENERMQRENAGSVTQNMYIPVGEEGDIRWVRFHRATKTQQEASEVGRQLDRASQEG